MKRFNLLLAVLTGWVCSSCSNEISVADRFYLDRNAMSFGHTGTDLGECGLVSQFEKGRSISGATAGGG